jgi:hypothetical protein
MCCGCFGDHHVSFVPGWPAVLEGVEAMAYSAKVNIMILLNGEIFVRVIIQCINFI